MFSVEDQTTSRRTNPLDDGIDRAHIDTKGRGTPKYDVGQGQDGRGLSPTAPPFEGTAMEFEGSRIVTFLLKAVNSALRAS
jgi:hypothetical protein